MEYRTESIRYRGFGTGRGVSVRYGVRYEGSQHVMEYGTEDVCMARLWPVGYGVRHGGAARNGGVGNEHGTLWRRARSGDGSMVRSSALRASSVRREPV